MLNDPTITASCDTCGRESEQMGLTALVGNCYDERNVKRDLQRMGWLVTPSETICDSCQEEQGEEA